MIQRSHEFVKGDEVMSYELAHDLLMDFAVAIDRLRRHNRTIRSNKCESREEGPCWHWLNENKIGPEEMCDSCTRNQCAYFFRQEALAQVSKSRKAIEKYANIISQRGE